MLWLLAYLEHSSVFGTKSFGYLHTYPVMSRKLLSGKDPIDPKRTCVGELCFTAQGKLVYSKIRSVLQRFLVSASSCVSSWHNLNWTKILSLTNKFFISNKTKEVSFEIMHGFYPAKNCFLKRFHFSIDVSWSFCNLSPGSTIHLFWDHSVTKVFWKNII